jgi:hypothetical protein
MNIAAHEQKQHDHEHHDHGVAADGEHPPSASCSGIRRKVSSLASPPWFEHQPLTQQSLVFWLHNKNAAVLKTVAWKKEA